MTTPRTRTHLTVLPSYSSSSSSSSSSISPTSNAAGTSTPARPIPLTPHKGRGRRLRKTGKTGDGRPASSPQVEFEFQGVHRRARVPQTNRLAISREAFEAGGETRSRRAARSARWAWLQEGVVETAVVMIATIAVGLGWAAFELDQGPGSAIESALSAPPGVAALPGIPGIPDAPSVDRLGNGYAPAPEEGWPAWNQRLIEAEPKNRSSENANSNAVSVRVPLGSRR